MKKSYIIVIVITSIITAVFTVGILTLTNTLAIGNNNIYTRDELSEKVDGLEYDTGWVSLIPYLNGNFVHNSSRTPEIRRIGEAIYMRGAVTGDSIQHGVTKYIFLDIPKIFRPSAQVITSNALGATGTGDTYRLTVDPSGNISSGANSYGTLPTSTMYLLDCVYYVN